MTNSISKKLIVVDNEIAKLNAQLCAKELEQNGLYIKEATDPEVVKELRQQEIGFKQAVDVTSKLLKLREKLFLSARTL